MRETASGPFKLNPEPPRAMGTSSHSTPPLKYLVDVPIHILVFGPDISHVVLAVAETHLGQEQSGS